MPHKEVLELYQHDNLDLTHLQELLDYDNHLQFNMAENIPEDKVLTSGVYRSSLFFTRLFEKTNNEIRMIVSGLDSKVSDIGGYIHELERCLQSNVKLDMIFTAFPNPKNITYKLLKEYEKTHKVNIFCTTKDTKKIIQEKFGEKVYFSTFDNNMYRKEISLQTHTGFGSFNAPKETKKYREIFDILKDSCVPCVL